MQSLSPNNRREVEYVDSCANLAVLQPFITIQGSLLKLTSLFKYMYVDTQNHFNVKGL